MILIKNKEQTHERWNQEQMKIMALDPRELKETTRENATPRCSKIERNSCIFCLGKILLIYKLSQFLPILLHISYIPILINHAHILVLCLWLEKFSLSHE